MTDGGDHYGRKAAEEAEEGGRYTYGREAVEVDAPLFVVFLFFVSLASCLFSSKKASWFIGVQCYLSYLKGGDTDRVITLQLLLMCCEIDDVVCCCCCCCSLCAMCDDVRCARSRESRIFKKIDRYFI